MRGDVDHDYLFQVGVDGLRNPVGSEEASTDPNDQYNRTQNTASLTGGYPFLSDQAFVQPGGYPPDVELDQTLLQVPIQYGGYPQDVAQTYDGSPPQPSSYGYISPDQQMAQYNQGLGPGITYQQYLQAQPDRLMDPTSYSDTQLRDQHDAGDAYGYGSVVPANGMYNQSSSMPIDQHIDPAFIPGVLKRHGNHQHQLAVYTDGLVDRVEADHLAPTAGGSEPYNSSLAGGRATIIVSPFWNTIQAQRSQETGPVDVDSITYAPIPGYVASEGVSVVANTDASDIQSWMALGDLHPLGTRSRPPIVPRPTFTDGCFEVLDCPVDDCDAKFTGNYRKGNLNRHYRLKHRGRIVEFPCKVRKCNRIFLRQDARLNHYRKDHPDLKVAGAVSRTPSCSGIDFSESPYFHANSNISNFG